MQLPDILNQTLGNIESVDIQHLVAQHPLGHAAPSKVFQRFRLEIEKVRKHGIRVILLEVRKRPILHWLRGETVEHVVDALDVRGIVEVVVEQFVDHVQEYRDGLRRRLNIRQLATPI